MDLLSSAPRGFIVAASAAVLCAFITTPSRVQAQAPEYSLTILSEYNGSYGTADSINSSGEVAGLIAGSEPVVWNGNTPTLLTLPDGYDAAGQPAINDAGQVAASVLQRDGLGEAAVWNGTTPTVLGDGGIGAAYANGINASGEVAGTVPLNDSRAVVWNGSEPGTEPTYLAPLSFSGVFAINASGEVVGSFNGDGGSRAVAWSGTTYTVLNSLGGDTSQAFAINEAGVVAGFSYLSSPSDPHAVLWNGTTPTDLGTLGGNSSMAYGINDSGEVVGDAATATNDDDGFLYTSGTMYDLNSLIAPGSGVTIDEAYGINDSGQIAADGYIVSNGVTQPVGLLLTPVAVPEPENFSILLLAGGAIFILCRRQKSRRY